jgi:hypothetical protein
VRFILLTQLFRKLSDFNGRPQLIGTLLIITGNVVVYSSSDEEFISNFDNLFPYIGNMLTSPQNTIRCMAQLTYEKIFKSLKERNLISQFDNKYSNYLTVTMDYMTANKSVSKWIVKYRPIFEQNPIKDSKPENLIGRPM